MIKVIITIMVLLLTSCNDKHDAHKGHDHEKHEGHDQNEHEGHDHGKHEGHGHDEHAKNGPNGGELLEVGEGVAEIEVIHNENEGSVKVYVYKEGGKEKLLLSAPPRINMTLDSGRKQLKTSAIGNAEKSHEFSITDDSLKGHVELTVALKINDQNYTVTVHHHH